MKTFETLEELEKIPYNGYTAISLFAGAGGSCMGLRKAGFNVVLANEIIPISAETYRLNHPNTILLERDIRGVRGEDILSLTNLKVGDLDVLNGSPPCCSYSTEGARERLWGQEHLYDGIMQKTDDLFDEYIRLVSELKPKVFICENVKGLSQGEVADVLYSVRKRFRKIGYNVDCKILDAQNYQVPQHRERLIFIGVRRDLKINPSFPLSVGGKITTKDAIEDLLGTGSEVPNWKTGKYITAMKELGPQCGYKEIEEWEKKHGEKLYRAQVFRDYWNTPCPTLKAHKDRYRHPLEDRFLNLMEERRLQTFPDDFKLIGNQDEQHARIGRSVPPQLMYYIAKNVKERILDVYYNKN